jgi:hypothetical protein
MDIKPIIPRKKVAQIEADFAEIKAAAREFGRTSIYFKTLLFCFLDIEYAYIALKFKSNKAMIARIAKCYERSPKTIYNMVNEVKVLIALGLPVDRISQSTALTLKGRVDQDNWREVFNIALELVDGNVSDVTQSVMKQAIQIFYGQLDAENSSDDAAVESEEPETSSFDDEEFSVKTKESSDEPDDWDDEEPEPPATRGRQKPSNQLQVTEHVECKSAKTEFQSQLHSNVEELKKYIAEMQSIVEEIEAGFLN